MTQKQIEKYTKEYFAQQGKKGGIKSWEKYKTKKSRKKRLENAHSARRKKKLYTGETLPKNIGGI